MLLPNFDICGKNQCLLKKNSIKTIALIKENHSKGFIDWRKIYARIAFNTTELYL